MEVSLLPPESVSRARAPPKAIARLYWFELLFILNQFIVTDITVATLPDTTESVPDTTVSVIPVVQMRTTDITESSVPEGSISAVGDYASATSTRSDQVVLDGFDSEGLLDALSAIEALKLRTPDLNVGVADCGADDEVECELLSSEEAQTGGGQPDDVHAMASDVPVEFRLTDEALDRLQAEEWGVLHEPASNQVIRDAAPRYDGPSGPARAVLAYVSSPLAIFYFFLSKELWRKIAEESDKFRKDSIDEVAQAIRARTRQRRESIPSTIVLSVDEYKAKLKRMNSIQPHGIVRFIGLLIARALEPRRERLSRHWVTMVEVTLSRLSYCTASSGDEPRADTSRTTSTTIDLYGQLLHVDPAIAQAVTGITRIQPIEATTTDSASRVKKTSPKKTQVPATATAPSANQHDAPEQASKRKEVLMPGPYLELATSESDTDTPNPDLITGEEDPNPDPTAPRATKPREGGLAAASTSGSEPAPAEEAPIPSPEEPSIACKAEAFLKSSGTHDPKGSASATTPA
ncbi:unnamed protein product [Phytophthora fragariaefolia]|uniref:Unnamed protein product n=1 Tax=Phytophthora fragariaefolia TaxID=1490495 RepID=A0A9W6XFF1_9STRA|nr:unnamed protein product [Phytophthora fragariaefolia]